MGRGEGYGLADTSLLEANLVPDVLEERRLVIYMLVGVKSRLAHAHLERASRESQCIRFPHSRARPKLPLTSE